MVLPVFSMPRSIPVAALILPILAVLVTACGQTAAVPPTPSTAPTVRATAAPFVAATTVPSTAVPPTAVPPTAAAAVPSAPLAAPRLLLVRVVDNRFEPPHSEVAAGTTIRWTNNGTDDHDVVALDLKSFESPVLKPGQTFEATFAQAATIPYVCTLHDGMTASLVVR